MNCISIKLSFKKSQSFCWQPPKQVLFTEIGGQMSGISNLNMQMQHLSSSRAARSQPLVQRLSCLGYPKTR